MPAAIQPGVRHPTLLSSVCGRKKTPSRAERGSALSALAPPLRPELREGTTSSGCVSAQWALGSATYRYSTVKKTGSSMYCGFRALVSTIRRYRPGFTSPGTVNFIAASVWLVIFTSVVFSS